MSYELDKQEPVCVTLTVGEWAKVVAAVGSSPLDLYVKQYLNERIFDCVQRTERTFFVPTGVG
jgi:hypothetical protein